MIISVESRFESAGEEVPEFFFLGKQRISVIDINDRWLSQDHSYFKVVADDKATYILRHDKTENIWELTLFNAPSHAEF